MDNNIKLSSKDQSYNNNLYIRESHNCYNYFLNLKSKKAYDNCKNFDYKKNKICRRAQPGYAANLHKMTKDDYKCDKIEKRTLLDNKLIFKTGEDNICPIEYYKGALVVAPGTDFHYYRLNDDGIWSHKPGGTKTKITDASGNQIINPRISNRKFSNRLNYKDFCGYYCIPRDNKKKTMKMFKDIKLEKNKKKNKTTKKYNNK